MKKPLMIFLALCMCGVVHAQNVSVDGAWGFQVQTQFRTDAIVLEFRTDGELLSGTVTRSNPPGQPPANLEGVIHDDQLSFSVRSPDGLRVITMEGIVTGDEIHFTRGITGDPGRGPGDSFYGLNGPHEITATRVKP